MRIILTFSLLVLLANVTYSQRIVNVTEYGISANSKSDQSSKVNDMIRKNINSIIFFPKGTYIVNKIIISNTITLSGSGAVIRGNYSVTGPIIEIKAGNVAIKDLIIDGNYDRAVGIYVLTGTGPTNVSIENCLIQNMHGSAREPGYGIQIRRNLTAVKILNTRIVDIDGPENGIEGDTYGANRGIYINNVNDVLIAGCTIADVKGYEDGDCIHFYTWKEDMYPSFIGQVTIENNIFENVYKRAMKIMAKNAIIRNNACYDQRHDQGLSYSGISIYGDNNLIESNVVDLLRSNCGISLEKCKGNMVLSNKIKVDEFRYQNKWRDLWAPIKIIDTYGIRIQDNTFSGQVKPDDIILRNGSNENISQN